MTYVAFFLLFAMGYTLLSFFWFIRNLGRKNKTERLIDKIFLFPLAAIFFFLDKTEK